MVVFINVYEVTRRYGGPEEGGWWWDDFVCVGSIPHRTEVEIWELIIEDEDGNDIWREDVASKRKILFDVWGFGPTSYYPRFVYYLEPTFGYSNTTSKPTYE